MPPTTDPRLAPEHDAFGRIPNKRRDHYIRNGLGIDVAKRIGRSAARPLISSGGNIEARCGIVRALYDRPAPVTKAACVPKIIQAALVIGMVGTITAIGVDAARCSEENHLIQIHNLIDWETQLVTLTEWKKQGRIPYTGITTSRASAHADTARALEKQRIDFVQINYSLMEREAEERVLPVAKERGVAVIVNRPFGRGDLFGRVREKPLPEWAAEIDCKSWGQFFLKWIVAHPAVTCVIPATSNPHHMEDNLQGGVGRLPDEKMRRRMVEAMNAI